MYQESVCHKTGDCEAKRIAIFNIFAIIYKKLNDYCRKIETIMDYYLISGGVSGAITDIYSEEADNHAQMYYREIRSYSTDVEKIVENTNGGVNNG